MDELTLRDYLKVIFRQKWVIIVAIITVTVTVALGIWIKTPVYVAQVKMLVSGQKSVEAPYYTGLVSMQNIQVALTQSEIVKSNPVMERTLKAVGLKPLDFEKKFASPPRRFLIDRQAASINSFFTKRKLDDQQKQGVLFRLALEDLKNNVKVEPVRDTNLFTISYTDFDPGIAAAIANIISRSYIIFDLEQQLAELQMKYGDKNLAVTQLKDSITKMEQSLNGQTLPNIEAIGPASVKIVEQAMPPMKPTGLSNSIIMVLAVFMSVFLGIMLAFGFEYMDQTFKSPQDVEGTLNIPYLGSIPKKANTEEFSHVGDQLFFEIKDKGIKSVLITAALPKEGVTTVAANIAKHIAGKSGRKTLVIDANLRNPSLHNALNVSSGAGLVDVLEGKLTFDKALMDINDKLSVLTAGKADLNPATLIESHKMAEVLKTAKDKFEVIIIDSPNLRESKDAINVASCADGVVLMVNEGRTRRQVAKAALLSLRSARQCLVAGGAIGDEAISSAVIAGPKGSVIARSGAEDMSLRAKRSNLTSKPVLLGAILGSRTFAIPKVIYERV